MNTFGYFAIWSQMYTIDTYVHSARGNVRVCKKRGESLGECPTPVLLPYYTDWPRHNRRAPDAPDSV